MEDGGDERTELVDNRRHVCGYMRLEGVSGGLEDWRRGNTYDLGIVFVWSFLGMQKLVRDCSSDPEGIVDVRVKGATVNVWRGFYIRLEILNATISDDLTNLRTIKGRSRCRGWAFDHQSSVIGPSKSLGGILCPMKTVL